MIHSDEYQQIRRARVTDIPSIMTMMRQSVEDAALAPRSREQVHKRINDFFVFELDGNLVGTVAVHMYETDEKEKVAELACLFVSRAHKNKGHGRKLVAYAEDMARQRGAVWIFALSTQASRFFEEKMGYVDVGPGILPSDRREQYDRSGRNSKVLKKEMFGKSGSQ